MHRPNGPVTAPTAKNTDDLAAAVHQAQAGIFQAADISQDTI